VTVEEFKSLRPGDVVRGRTYGKSYVVVENRENVVLVARTLELTNPIEWELASRREKK